MPETATAPKTPRLYSAYAAAVRRLVFAFACTDQELVREAYGESEEVYSFPMWGTLFKVVDSCDRRRIESLMESPIPTGGGDDDIKTLMEGILGIDGGDDGGTDVREMAARLYG